NHELVAAALAPRRPGFGRGLIVSTDDCFCISCALARRREYFVSHGVPAELAKERRCAPGHEPVSAEGTPDGIRYVAAGRGPCREPAMVAQNLVTEPRRPSRSALAGLRGRAPDDDAGKPELP